MVDTQKIIICPACGKEMTKVFIEAANCYIDVCADGCGGIYFDNREFKRFDEQHEDIDQIISEYKNKTYQKANEDKTRICPACNSKMVKHYASHLKQVEIDECYCCGGIFLDYGELEEIRKQFKKEEDRSHDYVQSLLQSCPEAQDFINYKSKTPEEIFNKKILFVLNLFK